MPSRAELRLLISLRLLTSAAVTGCLLAGCDGPSKRPEAEASGPQATTVLRPVEVHELLPMDLLLRAGHYSFGAEDSIAASHLDGCGGIRYEWPLQQREKVDRLNRQMTLASLASGQPVRLLPSMGRVTLTRRADGLSLVAVRQRLAERAQGTSEEARKAVPHPVAIGSASGLWCPSDRVLHFDTVRGPLSLAVELGGEEQRDREMSCRLAQSVIARAQDEFLGLEPQDESWLEPER